MVSPSTDSAAQEWRASWAMVIAACIGMSFHSVTTYGFGLFIEPLTAEFGWSRSQVSSGLSVAALLSVPLAPLLGAMVDRWGSRRLALPGIIMTGLCLTSFSLANGSVTQWLVLWAGYAILSVGVNSTVWAAAISGVFTAGRGLALGVTLSGAALAQVFAPPLAQWLIDGYGWRMAFVGLGVGWGAPALLLCLFFLFDAHDRQRSRQRDKKGPTLRPSLPGLSIGAACRNLALLRIGAATLIMMILTIAVIVHQVPLLTELGVSRQTAALLAGLTGAAGLVGKLVTGYLMDRMHAGLVSSLTMGVAALAFLMLLEPSRSLPLVVLSMVILGYSSGSKFQICAYQTSRYAGMRNFGKIFGVMSCLVALGAGLGPFAAGLIYDLFGSYRPLVLVGIPASLISGLLLFRLGPYPEWRAETVSGIPASS